MSNDDHDDTRRAPAARPTGPMPLARLTDLADLLGGESHRSRRFLGGVVVGALLGAALAGGSLMRRRRRDED